MKTLISLIIIVLPNILNAQLKKDAWILGKDTTQMIHILFTDSTRNVMMTNSITLIPYWETFSTNYAFRDKNKLHFSFNGWYQTVGNNYDKNAKDKYGRAYPFQLKDAYQCAITLPQPTKENRANYTIFTSDSLGNKKNKLYYTYVDDSSTTKINGQTIYCPIKGKIILEGTFQPGGITACKHGNGNEWWTVLADNQNNLFYKILLKKDTILVFDTQEINSYFDNKEKTWACFSANGKYYVRYQQWGANRHVINIYDFDRCTGKLSNHRYLFFTETNGISKNGHIVISPNSKLIYLSTGSSIYQLKIDNLNAPTIEIAKNEPNDTICGNDGCHFNRMVISPDGKLYIIDENKAYLHIIDNPNMEGLSCNLKKGTSGMSLPVVNNIKVFPNHTNYFLNKDECFTNLDNDISNILDISVFPNPGSNLIKIKLPTTISDAKFIFFDILGNQILNTKISNFSEIDTFDLKSGLYVYKIIISNKEVFCGKWIKQ